MTDDVKAFAERLAAMFEEDAENARTLTQDGYAVRGPATSESRLYDRIARNIRKAAEHDGADRG